MKKIVCNVVFALGVLALLSSNAFCNPGAPGAAPDAASTSAMLGIAGFGLVALRKYLR